MHETLRRSSLGEAGARARAVNLELPLRADATASAATSCRATSTASATVRGVREDGFARVVTIERRPDAAALRRREGLDRRRRRLAHRRARRRRRRSTVSLIPETLERTTLGAADPGRRVNLEVDVLAKYVEKLVSAR